MQPNLTKLTKKIVGDIFSIHGFIQKPEALLLYKLARSASGKGVIVELGSWKGRSTVFLALGSKDGPRKKIYAVDHFKGDEKIGLINTFPQFKKNINKFKISSFVVPINNTTAKAAGFFKKTIALLWIDASHKYEDVLNDFILWEPYVAEEGIIALHDTLLPDGPRKVLQTHILKTYRFKIITFVESITVIKKVKKITWLDMLVNHLRFHLRDITYFLYLYSWPLRRIASKLYLYREKEL